MSISDTTMLMGLHYSNSGGSHKEIDPAACWGPRSLQEKSAGTETWIACTLLLLIKTDGGISFAELFELLRMCLSLYFVQHRV